jgi:hypothetical protein
MTNKLNAESKHVMEQEADKMIAIVSDKLKSEIDQGKCVTDIVHLSQAFELFMSVYPVEIGKHWLHVMSTALSEADKLNNERIQKRNLN